MQSTQTLAEALANQPREKWLVPYMQLSKIKEVITTSVTDRSHLYMTSPLSPALLDRPGLPLDHSPSLSLLMYLGVVLY